jgi:methylated-DNA-[protein]-cysteine S-methyltransferase
MTLAAAPELELVLAAGEAGIRAIEFRRERIPEGVEDSSYPLLLEAARQLKSYFAGELREFSLPLDPRGTEFQLRVWRQLETIPYGSTRSYAEIARAVGSPKAVRAVGAANGANPISIVVPCHRVIGSSGKLVGYGGGLPLKQRLLALERGAGLFD